MEIRLHDNEIPIDVDVVRNLIDTEYPEYISLPLRRLRATGSTNMLFRLGDELLVRMPRQPGGGKAIDREQRWLPEIGPHLPVAVPELVAVGQPAFNYSERWSIVRWLEGNHPTTWSPAHAPNPERLRLAICRA